MEDGLGSLGFWIFLGLIVASGTISGALKERGKDSEKLALLRALMEKDGQSTSAVLAYLRERDAAEAAEAARAGAQVRAGGQRFLAVLLAVVTFGAGIFVFMATAFGIFGGFRAAYVPVVAGAIMLGVWAAGLAYARRIWRSANRQNDADPDA